MTNKFKADRKFEVGDRVVSTGSCDIFGEGVELRVTEVDHTDGFRTYKCVATQLEFKRGFWVLASAVKALHPTETSTTEAPIMYTEKDRKEIAAAIRECLDCLNECIQEGMVAGLDIAMETPSLETVDAIITYQAPTPPVKEY